MATARLPEVPLAPIREAVHRNDSVHARFGRFDISSRGNVVYFGAGSSSGYDNPDGGATGSDEIIVDINDCAEFGHLP